MKRNIFVTRIMFWENDGNMGYRTGKGGNQRNRDDDDQD